MAEPGSLVKPSCKAGLFLYPLEALLVRVRVHPLGFWWVGQSSCVASFMLMWRFCIASMKHGVRTSVIEVTACMRKSESFPVIKLHQLSIKFLSGYEWEPKKTLVPTTLWPFSQHTKDVVRSILDLYPSSLSPGPLVMKGTFFRFSNRVALRLWNLPLLCYNLAGDGEKDHSRLRTLRSDFDGHIYRNRPGAFHPIKVCWANHAWYF